MDVALGSTPADLVIRGARLLDVFTATFLDRQQVAIANGQIAFVGPDAGHTIGPGTRQLEADGQTVLPGLIDGHTHNFAARYSLDEFLRYAVPGGTTTVITEITELGNVEGDLGLKAALDALLEQPIKLFATLPPLVALLPHMESVAPSLEQYRELLARPEVLGLGEVYWGPVTRGDERLLSLIESTLALGKVVEGHGAGAHGPKLQSYVCAGISSDHEPITAETGLERLWLGQTLMVRDGEIRQDLEALAPLWQAARPSANGPGDGQRWTGSSSSSTAIFERKVERAIELGLGAVREQFRA